MALNGEVVPARPGPAARVTPQHEIDAYIPPGATELILKGIPYKTLKAYAYQWRKFRKWCEDHRRTFAPVSQATMLAYLADLRNRPIHHRCGCSAHRPAPQTIRQWHAAVKWYHDMGEPPLPWESGKKLALAIKGYGDEMVELGWRPARARRAYPHDVRAWVDALRTDDRTEQGIHHIAVILTGWYTAARASDLAVYRLADIERHPDITLLTLSKSKTNKRVGEVFETRAMRVNPDHPQYCGPTALEAWTNFLASKGVTTGSLFRPFTKGRRVDLEHSAAVSYTLDSHFASDAIQRAAKLAGYARWAEYSEHSLRRGRAQHLRELGVDRFDIAVAHGWAPNGSVHVYFEEVEKTGPESPAAKGML